MTTAAQSVNNVVTPFVKSYACIKSVLRFTTKEGQSVEFKHHSKDVYLYLLGWRENTGVSEIYPSRRKIAEETGHSIDSVKRAIKFLGEQGFISIGKKTVHSMVAGVRNTQEVNLYTVASLQEALAIIGGEEKGKQNAASHPTASATVENQEQPNNVVSLDIRKPVQHCDPLPVITNVIEEATNDSVLPANDCDNDRSDEVITVDVQDDLEMYTQIADNFGIKYNLPEIMHMCRGDRVRAAKRLKGEIDTFHNLAKQNAQKAARLVTEGDYGDDWNDSESDAY